MEIQNIRLGIIQVAVIVVQALAIGYYISEVKSDIKTVAQSTTRIEQNQNEGNKNQREFETATLTTVSDLRTRLAVLEAKSQKK